MLTGAIKKEDSTLTVFFPNNFSLSIPSQTSAQGIADGLVTMQLRSLSALVVIPDQAKILAKEGWSKQKVKEYIAQKTADRSEPAGWSLEAGGFCPCRGRRARNLDGRLPERRRF